eukprot:scaffold7520_cov21-Tisochrysis_lutea.AAC.3
MCFTYLIAAPSSTGSASSFPGKQLCTRGADCRNAMAVDGGQPASMISEDEPKSSGVQVVLNLTSTEEVRLSK